MPPRAGLTPELVVRTAAEMCDAGENLTMAGLAQRLGVRTPSLYNHIDGQEGLNRELTLYGLRELLGSLTTAGVGKAGPDALRSIADAYRAFARRRPGLYAYTLRAPATHDADHQKAASDALNVLQLTVAGMGLDGDDAIHAIRAYRSLLHGFVDLEMRGGFGLPVDLDESFRRALDGFLSGLETGE